MATPFSHKFCRRVGSEDFSCVHERYPIAATGFVHEVCGDKDRDLVVACEINHELPENIARDGIDSRGRLVKDQELWLMHHSDR